MNLADALYFLPLPMATQQTKRYRVNNVIMSLTEISGVWKRQWEEDPLGDIDHVDRTTMVLWIQTPSGMYVDLRLPKSSLDLPKAEMDASALEANGVACSDEHRIKVLSHQKSFAGVLNYERTDPCSCQAIQSDSILASLDHNGPIPLTTCTWHRMIDYQPPTGSLDIGVCCASTPINVDGSVDMRETGHDASYAEGWQRLPGTANGPFMALELVSDERRGYWVRAGFHFAYAVGRPKDTLLGGCEISSWKDILKKSTISISEKAVIMGSYVCIAGNIDEHSGTSIWTINHSTHPELVGCELAGIAEGTNVCSMLEWESDEVLVERLRGYRATERKWKIVQLDGCLPPVKNRATFHLNSNLS